MTVTLPRAPTPRQCTPPAHTPGNTVWLLDFRNRLRVPRLGSQGTCWRHSEDVRKLVAFLGVTR